MNTAKWTLVSYHPYLLFPDRFIFVKPEVTQRAAEVCGFEIHYTLIGQDVAYVLIVLSMVGGALGDSWRDPAMIPYPRVTHIPA